MAEEMMSIVIKLIAVLIVIALGIYLLVRGNVLVERVKDMLWGLGF